MLRVRQKNPLNLGDPFDREQGIIKSNDDRDGTIDVGFFKKWNPISRKENEALRFPDQPNLKRPHTSSESSKFMLTSHVVTLSTHPCHLYYLSGASLLSGIDTPRSMAPRKNQPTRSTTIFSSFLTKRKKESPGLITRRKRTPNRLRHAPPGQPRLHS